MDLGARPSYRFGQRSDGQGPVLAFEPRQWTAFVEFARKHGIV